MGSTARAPTLFLGHGSPMNAIEDNDFTRCLTRLGQELPRPHAVLCVSAHWLSAGTWVTHMPRPRTIHDFYGFPPELHAVEYAAPGSPETAELVVRLIESPRIQLDDQAWGLDHGAWSVLRHLYPPADVPIVQLSIDMAEPGDFHLELGQSLRRLRDEGVMIVGSGNLVHNLRQIRWDREAPPYDWAVEFDAWARDRIVAGDHAALARDYAAMRAGQLSVPTPDHYLPLLYVLGASHPGEEPRFEYEGLQNASISMRCVSFGR
jgi:4,5-DOPA dioxygenase extradiol